MSNPVNPSFLAVFRRTILPILFVMILTVGSLAQEAGEQLADAQLIELAQIKRVGVALFMCANDEGGKYPNSLDVLKGDYGIEDKLLVDKESGKPRWILTPGLLTSAKPDTILLQSLESKMGGKAVYYTGGTVKWVKDAK